jgi:hypothetical protein
MYQLTVLKRGYKLLFYVPDMDIRHIGSSVFYGHVYHYSPNLNLKVGTD